ncbi:helix-turn-helix transcriptional regulator [uncultured Microscilla sp.]|uniref:helix-turn-helix domain-containing protein n=1 Tax=uncultured Microscilla sp. TaxID=432653 RepID=UPI00262FD778|nr:helix-turn-helix transcriptional regulator [uncultured Microscilla sp.]
MNDITGGVAKRVQHVRVELKKSQGEIAEKVGLTQSQWAKIERNERKLDIETLVKLKTAFKSISIEYILFGKGSFFVQENEMSVSSNVAEDGKTVKKLLSYTDYLEREIEEYKLDIKTFENAIKAKGLDIGELLGGKGEADVG